MENTKTCISYSIFFVFFFRKSCRLWDNVETYFRITQATDDNIIRRTRIACWITKVTDTHSEYLLPFDCNNGCDNVPQCCVNMCIACIVVTKFKLL